MPKIEVKVTIIETWIIEAPSIHNAAMEVELQREMGAMHPAKTEEFMQFRELKNE